MHLAVHASRPAIWAVLCAGLLATVGCGAPLRHRSVASPVFRAASSRTDSAAWRHGSAVPDAGEMVERALRGRGIRFGTDGTSGAVFAYVRMRHRLVPAGQARAGDLVFFDIAGGQQGCGTHVGIVEGVDGDGRIAFRESRGGLIRHSYAYPAEPTARRSASGEVLNTFLRAKRIDDPDDARYFAGEMLCAVGRIGGG